MIGTSFSFDAIQVNTQTNTLTISGKVVECEPKLFELLIFSVEIVNGHYREMN